MLERIDDPLTVDVFTRLFAAEDEETMELVFAELEQLGESLTAEYAKAVAKARVQRGVQRRESWSTLADAAAEWGFDFTPPSKEQSTQEGDG